MIRNENIDLRGRRGNITERNWWITLLTKVAASEAYIKMPGFELPEVNET